jgi:pimeloyl-ACP methyl ester carboxylesterase
MSISTGLVRRISGTRIVTANGDTKMSQTMSWIRPEGAAAPGRYADVNGIHIYYEVHGEGRPLVLLHGGLGSLDMFGPTLPALAAGRRVIAMDLQGHGRTADVDRPLSIPHMADDIAAFIRHLGLGKTDILGYSLGGGIALQTAARHPELIDRIVIASAAIRRNAFYPDILAQQEHLDGRMADMMKGTPMHELYHAIAPNPANFPQLLDKIGAAMKNEFDFSNELASITAPTLIVAGDADMFPPSHAVEMFELLGGGKKDGGWDGAGRTKNQLAILPGVTHYTMGVEPGLVAAAISFLDADR